MGLTKRWCWSFAWTVILRTASASRYMLLVEHSVEVYLLSGADKMTQGCASRLANDYTIVLYCIYHSLDGARR